MLSFRVGQKDESKNDDLVIFYFYRLSEASRKTKFSERILTNILILKQCFTTENIIF